MVTRVKHGIIRLKNLFGKDYLTKHYFWTKREKKSQSKNKTIGQKLLEKNSSYELNEKKSNLKIKQIYSIPFMKHTAANCSGHLKLLAY